MTVQSATISGKQAMTTTREPVKKGNTAQRQIRLPAGAMRKNGDKLGKEERVI